MSEGSISIPIKKALEQAKKAVVRSIESEHITISELISLGLKLDEDVAETTGIFKKTTRIRTVSVMPDINKILRLARKETRISVVNSMFHEGKMYLDNRTYPKKRIKLSPSDINRIEQLTKHLSDYEVLTKYAQEIIKDCGNMEDGYITLKRDWLYNLLMKA